MPCLASTIVYIISSITLSFRRMKNIELLIISNFYKIIYVEKQVYYDIFRYYSTRLFTFWTVSVSIFDFPSSTTIFFFFLIFSKYYKPICMVCKTRKDNVDGHWWLQLGNTYLMGYWPSSLFSVLSNSASIYGYG